MRTDEVRFRHLDGTWRTLTLTAKNLENVRGIEAIVVNARDITHQKALETELRQAQRMETVGQLAGGVAHDFNNLLTAINGRTEFLAESKASMRASVRMSKRFRLAAGRAASLTRQLLAFSRKQVLMPRVVDLNGVIRNMERMLRRLIGEDIVVQVVQQEDLGHITADSGQLEQILLNLCVNSRDAMPDGGVLRIETANVSSADTGLPTTSIDAANLVMLCVSDTGARDGRSYQGSHLRAVLYNQTRRKRDRSRALYGLRYRQTVRRDHHCRNRPRTRDFIPYLLYSNRRRA